MDNRLVPANVGSNHLDIGAEKVRRVRFSLYTTDSSSLYMIFAILVQAIFHAQPAFIRRAFIFQFTFVQSEVPMSTLKKLAFSILLITSGFYLGFIVTRKQYSSVAETKQLRLGQDEYINPLLACDNNNGDVFEELNPLKKKLETSINQMIADKNATKISIYFRDLKSGAWTGVNENDQYIPASLIKLPLLVVYYKLAQFNPKILTQRIVFGGGIKTDSRQIIAPPPVRLVAGKSYTISELIKNMIVYSDNDSYNVLNQFIDQKLLEQIYTDLGLAYSKTSPNEATVSPKLFTTFLRILYNASYLTRDYSQQALELLNETSFRDGIAAGIPAEIKIAHKFGARTITENGEVQFRELHDCGIIYYPNNPYAICVMTHGQDFLKLESVIQTLSKIIFNSVKAKY